MVIRYNDILELMTVLSEDKNLQVTVSESLKGGLTAGVAATLGGLLLGPRGLALGGALGGVLGAVMSEDKFKPVSQAIMEMSDPDQRRLVEAIRNIVRGLDASDAVELIAIVQGNELLKAKVMTEMVRFLRSEINLRIDDTF